MSVTINGLPTKEMVPFKDIVVGNFFVYNRCLCLKGKTETAAKFAVSVGDGMWFSISDEARVEPVSVEINVTCCR